MMGISTKITTFECLPLEGAYKRINHNVKVILKSTNVWGIPIYLGDSYLLAIDNSHECENHNISGE